MRSKIIIKGKAQGVFFRKFVKDKAKELGLTGTVRNKDDGSVEAIVEGNKESILSLTRECNQGPPGSDVTAVFSKEEKETGEFDDFKIVY